MTMRVHTGRADGVGVSVLSGEVLVGMYGEGFLGIEQGLVIEDTGNCEALVLVGDWDDLADFGLDIMRRVSAARSEAETTS